MSVFFILLLAIFCLPIIAVLIYMKIQLLKKIKPPFVLNDFSEAKIIQEVIDSCFKNANDWNYLVVLYLSLHYVFNVWAMCFSLLTFFVISFNETINNSNNFALAISLCAVLSLLSTVLNLIVKPKDKFIQMNEAWEKAYVLMLDFNLSIINKNQEEIIESINRLKKELYILSKGIEFI